MPQYRVEAWVQHPELDFEDQLEERIQSAVKGMGIGVLGIVAYRIFAMSERVYDRESNAGPAPGPPGPKAVECGPTSSEPEAGDEAAG